MRNVRAGRDLAQRVTLVEVAADAHVSRATASLVLRDSPLVAGDTRERVLASMRALGYVYHRAAASMRSGRSRTVELIITDIANPFFAELTVGVEDALDAANHVVMLSNTGESLGKQERLLATMRENNADGILWCPAEGTPPESVDALRRWRLPFVLLARYLFDRDVDYVGADNVLGARLGVEHLIGLGHRRIAFIGGPATSSARRERLQGYMEALRCQGLDVDERLLPISPATREGGRAAILDLLAGDEPPTAALCYSDVVALGALLGLQSVGREPGRDFAVVGFDDIADAALAHPPLTTLSVAPRTIGRVAAQLLLDRVADPDAAPRQVVLAPALVVRASCGAPITPVGTGERRQRASALPVAEPLSLVAALVMPRKEGS